MIPAPASRRGVLAARLEPDADARMHRTRTCTLPPNATTAPVSECSGQLTIDGRMENGNYDVHGDGRER
jgi:hypothetical protein